MSVRTSSKYLYTMRKNNEYHESDVMEYNIPAENMLLNTKETYQVMIVKLASKQYKLCPDERAGLNGFIRNFQASSGTGQVVESIANYGILYANKDYYESSQSMDNRKYLHEGKPNKTVIDDSSACQYLDATESDPSKVYKTVEACLPFYLSGCLSPHRDKVFPNVALKGLNVRVELANAETALQAVKAPLYTAKDYQNFKTLTYGGYDSETGYAVLSNIEAGNDTLLLKNVTNVLSTESEDFKRVLSADVSKPAHLFMVGQHVVVSHVDGSEETYEIKTVTMDQNNIALQFTTVLTEDVEEDDSVYVSTETQYNDLNFTLSNVRMNLGLVETQPQYIESMLRRVKAGTFQFDIFSFTDYGMNISSNSNNNSLKINCRNTRALSLISIPQSAKANSVLESSYTSDKNEPRDYNLSLYNNIIVPSKLVPLDKFNNANKALYNAVALREMEKALRACPGWSVNNLKNPCEQFFIGRQLATKGFSYNCNNELTLNINYNEVKALLMHNFICHLRRVDCRDDGVFISY